METLSATVHIKQETQPLEDVSAIVAGKHSVIVQILFITTFKDESTIDLALRISMKGMSNESTAEVLRIQLATLKRWLALGTKQWIT